MILITKMLLKDGNCAKKFFLGRGYIGQTLTRLTRLTNLPESHVLWSINNQFWSIYFIYFDLNISIHFLGLEGLVNLVNLETYTPPHERKTGEFWSM
jgi:hypothetical protein